MYATCLFCHSRLGSNEVVEHFPVGRRLAFDARRGRLWVVCGGCGRWNLTPLEERWEAIEECERMFRAARTRVTTDEIGLARLGEGLELVRIGEPLRPEFAAWRYGTRFTNRRKKVALTLGGAAAVAGVGAIAFAPVLVPAMAMSALGIVVLPGITSVMGVIPALGALQLKEYYLNDRIVGRLVYRPNPNWGPRQVTVRVKHVAAAELIVRGRDPASVSLDLPHDTGWAHFDGIEAMQAASTLLSGVNYFGARGSQVQEAVRRVEEYGDAPTFLRAASSIGDARNSRLTSVLNAMRGLGAMRMSSTECLALEMALHEESERRALEGELALLEAAWRDAEAVARVADSI
jgi:hypothetical protein